MECVPRRYHAQEERNKSKTQSERKNDLVKRNTSKNEKYKKKSQRTTTATTTAKIILSRLVSRAAIAHLLLMNPSKRKKSEKYVPAKRDKL